MAQRQRIGLQIRRLGVRISLASFARWCFFVVAHTPNKARANLQHGIEDCPGWAMLGSREKLASGLVRSISGLVVEYIVAIDVTRARFPADALLD